MTSCPASTASAAATAESTPPDRAASSLTGPGTRRARSTTAGSASSRASTSAAVELWPSEKRSEPRARSSSAPIATSTWEGRATPAEQAEPVDTSTPRASSSSSSESPSQPGKEKCALPGSRSTGSPLRTASGTAASTRRTRSSRSGLEPRRLCGARAPTATVGGGGEPGQRRRVERAGAHVALLAAAVQQRGAGRRPRPSSSAPAPSGPPYLCPVTVSASTPLAAKSTGSWPTACTASVCSGTPCRVRDLGQLGDRLDRADLVVGPHDADQRDVVAERGRQRRRGAPGRRRRPAAR